ncbi:MAG: MBL fold metallo-hydrolase [Acidilobaceae archaeon]
MVDVRVVDATPQVQGFSSVYLVGGSRGYAMIDAGPSNGSSKVLEYVRSAGLRVCCIVLTHIHVDHGGASGVFSREFGAPVYVHPRGARHVVDPSVLWEQSRQALGPVADYYGRPVPVEESMVRVPGDGDTIDLGGATLKIIYTPGHASHHMSVFLVEEGIMFTGDSGGVVVDGEVKAPTTPYPFKPKPYLESIDRMLRENVRRAALAHYGLADEGAQYLKWHAEEVRSWLDEIVKLVSLGVNDPLKIAEELTYRDRNAKIAANSRISHLYYNSVIGMARAVLEGEWP